MSGNHTETWPVSHIVPAWLLTEETSDSAHAPCDAALLQLWTKQPMTNGEHDARGHPQGAAGQERPQHQWARVVVGGGSRSRGKVAQLGAFSGFGGDVHKGWKAVPEHRDERTSRTQLCLTPQV